MTKVVAILGRQPALGLAELESLFGAAAIQPLEQAAIIDTQPDTFPLARLGGTLKAAKLLTTLPFTDWRKITDYLIQHVPEHVHDREPGKLTFGLSVYGLSVNPPAINATALSVKKAVRASDQRPVRVVPNTTAELNSAQVLHNRMTDGDLGMELLLVRDGAQTHLAQTFAVQDIDAYAARDQARPKRDARVGMLPPKLAQIIVNLAVAQAQPHHDDMVYDPFCGTGVVLQEAALMGFGISGSDLEPRMVEYTDTNLQWLLRQPANQNASHDYQLKVADAARDDFPAMKFIATETYLGRPFSALPNPAVLQEVMRDVDTIHRKFLKNVRQQVKPGLRLCIAVPAWKTPHGFKHLPTLDSLEEIGYTRISFVHTANGALVYHRPEQIVARELVVLTKK